MSKNVLILGGGIAGIGAAIDLAESGVSVYLIESSPSLGGRMAQLDKTFPTNDCSTCILAPKVTECFTHPRVTTYTYSEVLDLKGSAGDFTVVLKRKARYIDEEKCTGCGLCIEKCPVKVKDSFNQNLNQRKAVYKLYDQGVPNVCTIDDQHCLKLLKGRCGLCEKVCDVNAVKYNDQDQIIELKVGAVILASGYDAFWGGEVSEYGYGRFDNVVTSLEYERMLSASGPTDGHIIRPSDGQEAKKIAFLHCVGSRDYRTDHTYCSAVCCMYSLKQAVITLEHNAGSEGIDLYYMDMRSYGKDFEQYYNSIDAKEGIRLFRSRAAALTQNTFNQRVAVKGIDEKGHASAEEYDLIVLGVGLSVNEKMKKLLQKLKVRVNKHGFVDTDEFNPLLTSREGVFACGAITGPRDIPESVIQASGAAASARALVINSDQGDLSLDLLPQQEQKKLRFTDNERARIGVFVCHCGSNIAGVVDVDWVAKKSKELPYVEYAGEVMYLCAADGLDLMAKIIEENKLNRIVIASCTPRTHETLFRKGVEKAGLNPYLMVMTNIRDQNSWVHMQKKDQATLKAFDLVRGAVSRAVRSQTLERSKVDKLDTATVLGGGVSGMIAALSIAKGGFGVDLIEREKELGGQSKHLAISFNSRPAKNFLNNLIAEVNNHPLINVYNNYQLQKVGGYIGSYKLNLASSVSDQDALDLETGVVVVATGAQELSTTEYCAEEEMVISQKQLGEMLLKGPLPANIKKIVMIQCVGSREKEREYCSRICCSQAVFNALYLKEANPELQIVIFYRDLRTYGYHEDNYRKARSLGVQFIRFEQDQKPQIQREESSFRVNYQDQVTANAGQLTADMIVLSKAIVPTEGNKELSKLLKVPLNQDGFFLEAHVKLRPVDFATDGIFICGLAHGPKNLGEAVAQGLAAASRATVILAQEYLLTEPMIAEVNEDLCFGCGNCEEVCPYGAVEIDSEKNKSKVNRVLCKGCGSCTAVCRSHAVDLLGFSNEELTEEIAAIFNEQLPSKYVKGGLSID